MIIVCFRAILDDWNVHFGVCIEFCRISGNFQKPPGGVEGPRGGSCLQNHFWGFLLCTAWRLSAVRQATETALHSSREWWCFRDVGMLGSDSYDMKIFGTVNCYLWPPNWSKIVWTVYEFGILGFMLGSGMNDITNVMRGALIACDLC